MPPNKPIHLGQYLVLTATAVLVSTIVVSQQQQQPSPQSPTQPPIQSQPQPPAAPQPVPETAPSPSLQQQMSSSTSPQFDLQVSELEKRLSAVRGATTGNDVRRTRELDRLQRQLDVVGDRVETYESTQLPDRDRLRMRQDIEVSLDTLERSINEFDVPTS